MEDEREDSSSDSSPETNNESRGFSDFGIPLMGHDDEDESGDERQSEKGAGDQEDEEEDEGDFALPAQGDMGDPDEEAETANMVEECLKLFSSKYG